jgi:hypothetical protein
MTMRLHDDTTYRPFLHISAPSRPCFPVSPHLRVTDLRIPRLSLLPER